MLAVGRLGVWAFPCLHSSQQLVVLRKTRPDYTKIAAFNKYSGGLLTPRIMTDIHVKCRSPYEYVYRDRGGQTRKIKRHEVPAGKISWDVPFQYYDPITFD